MYLLILEVITYSVNLGPSLGFIDPNHLLFITEVPVQELIAWHENFRFPISF